MVADPTSAGAERREPSGHRRAVPAAYAERCGLLVHQTRDPDRQHEEGFGTEVMR